MGIIPCTASKVYRRDRKDYNLQCEGWRNHAGWHQGRFINEQGITEVHLWPWEDKNA